MLRKVLVRDLRAREKQIRCLEAKNATLADKSVTADPTTLENTRSRPRHGPPACSTTARDNQQMVRPIKRTSFRAKLEAQKVGVRGERRPSREEKLASGGVGSSTRTATSATNKRSEQEQDVRREAQQNTSGGNSGGSTATASVSLLARKKLAAPASQVSGRATTISYPRRGSRATFTPISSSYQESSENAVMPLEGGLIQEEGICMQEEGEEEEEEQQDEWERDGEAEREHKDQERAHEQRHQQQQLDEADTLPLADSGESVADVGGARRSEGPNEAGEEQRERCRISSSSPGEQQPDRGCTLEDAPVPPRKARHTLSMPPLPVMPPLTAKPSNLPPSPADVAPDSAMSLGRKDSRETAAPKPAEASKFGEEIRGREAGGHEGTLRTTYPGDNKSVDGVVVETVLPPSQPATATAGSNRVSGGAEPDEGKRPVEDCGGGVEAEREARHGGGVDVGRSVLHGLEEVQVGENPRTTESRSRLLGGVPVWKYGGRGKPKAKTLWVTPDLSEIFYTQAGR